MEAADGSVASVFAQSIYPAGDIQGHNLARPDIYMRRQQRNTGRGAFYDAGC
jgi:hypothetical protein